MSAGLLGEGPIKPGERQRLLAHLDLTETWLTDEVSGLSPTQLKWRAADDKWSVLEVVEHLAIAEPQYWADLQKAAKGPAATVKPKSTDADMLWYGVDRTNRQKTGEARRATGRFEDLATPLGMFHKLRSEMIAYAKTTEDDLRSRNMPGDGIDVYQWFVMISSHSQRHIMQIREIKSSPGFPKK
jgi:hypothetical protein